MLIVTAPDGEEEVVSKSRLILNTWAEFKVGDSDSKCLVTPKNNASDDSVA